jgi:2-dehydro-3-deoxygluconokinase
MLTSHRVDPSTARAFDVVCVGDPLLKIGAVGPRSPRDAGAVNVALSLAAAGRRVGLCTTLADDRHGRAWLETLAARGIDAGGVRLVPPRRGAVLVPGAPVGAEIDVGGAAAGALEVPQGWSARLLVLSGLLPATSRAAAFCRAARRARRDGTLVVLDFDASLRAWSGRDPRTIRMVLREVDVARCSVADLAVLGMDTQSARAALRPGAVLLVSDPDGGAVASGPFGEVAAGATAPVTRRRTGDAFVAALCLELLHGAPPGATPESTWHRALRTAVAAQSGAR